MQPPLPSLTPTWHNDTYPAISPDRPELSVDGKVVVITGAGGSIGGEMAVAFAKAKAKLIVLLGRDEDSLKATQGRISARIETSFYKFDTIDEENTKEVAAKIGTWDILVMCAGYMPSAGKIETASSSDWWKGFETNVKGTYNTIKSFIPSANSKHANMMAITTAGVMTPAPMLVGLSSYIPSKLAQGKLMEFVSPEYPHIATSDIDPEQSPMDSVALPANFAVWLTSLEASFLNGRTVWANWDVTELVGQKDEITRGTLLTTANFAFPYGHV